MTERVIDDGVLEVLPSAPQKSDFDGTTSTDYYNTIFRTEDGKNFLSMEEVMEKSIEAYAKINASDASNEYKAQAIAELEKGIINVLNKQDFRMAVITTGYTQEEKNEAIDKSLEMSAMVNTSKDNIVDNFIQHLRDTNGETTTKDAIKFINQEAQKNGDLSFETVSSLTDSLNGGNYTVTAGELVGIKGDEATKAALEQIAKDIRGGSGNNTSAAAAEQIYDFIFKIAEMSEEEAEEEIEDLLYLPSTDKDDAESSKETTKSEVMKFVQQAAEKTGNGAVVQQMMAMNDSEDDELSNQISDLVFQNNVGTIGS